MLSFILDRSTQIEYAGSDIPVKKFIAILRRDIGTVCTGGASTGTLKLVESKELPSEAYIIDVADDVAVISAGDDLGFIYGLMFISREFLGVQPFWFWMEQAFTQKDSAVISNGRYESPVYKVKYRGWFFNDEVLMMGWPYNVPDKKGWEMAFEALLRCGGNMAIPGTDRMSRENKQMASDYGLWITHHHAEPLGAEMFKHAYPDLEADYFQYPDKFEKLWEDAVIEQKNMKVVWNLCFRGQGDCPFWANDKSGAYDTDEKRGRVISDLICKQAEIVKKYVENPVFCTNLYGEIMELYEAGHVTFPEGIILVKADNGFGRMVTRRRGNHNPRVNSMPSPDCREAQGIYYHVSFYDLQAANHVTMFPNTVSFVATELETVLKNGGDDFWVINCSNVRPHAYFLDAVSKVWKGICVTDESQALDFAKEYFAGDNLVAKSYMEFPHITPHYGKNDDEYAGEQLYVENIRYFARYALLGNKDCIQELKWLTGEADYKAQLISFADICKDRLDVQKKFYESVPDRAVTLKLQALMHYYSNLGVQAFYDGYCHMECGDYDRAFFIFGRCAEYFTLVDEAMRESCKGIWTGFYDNDCQADFKFTAYLVRKLMGYIRELGDNSEHYKWQHEYVYAKEDKGVSLMLLLSNHSTDEEIYQKMKERFL